MDKQNEVLKDLLNQITLFIIEDRIVETAMVDTPKETEPRDSYWPSCENRLVLKRRIP